MDENESPFQPSTPGNKQLAEPPIETEPKPSPVEESLDDMATALRDQLRDDQRRRLKRK